MSLKKPIVGLLLLSIGISIFAVTSFSIGSDVPRDATWIFVPQSESTSDYELTGVTLRLDLTFLPNPLLQVELNLIVNNKTRAYGLGILQPLSIIEKDATIGSVSGPTFHATTNVTSSGSYFTRGRYQFPSLGSTSLVLSVPVIGPITSWKFGRRGTGFTFGSGYGISSDSEIAQFMQDTTPNEILNRGLTLSIIYPRSWVLSLSETFPQPDKQFALGQDRVATWFLNFSGVLPQYFVTVSPAWLVPQELDLREWANFISGIMIGIGSGVVAEGFKTRTKGPN